jgi:predicted small integral membrane protein
MIERPGEHCQGMLRINETSGKTFAITRLTSAFLKANLKINEVL